MLKLSGKLLQLQGTRRLVGDTEFDDVPDEPEEPDDDEADEMGSTLFEPDEEDAA